MCFHGGVVWVGLGPMILRCDVSTRQVLGFLEGRSKIVSCLLGVGQTVWSAGHDAKIKVRPCVSLAFLFTVSDCCPSKVWAAATGALLSTIEPPSQVYSLAYDSFLTLPPPAC
jgi:hypothetical protein